MWKNLPMIAASAPLVAAANLGTGVLRKGTWAAAQARSWARELAVSLAQGTLPSSAAYHGNGQRGNGHADHVLETAPAVSYVEGRPDGLAPMTVAYERHGAGRPVVLLHGIGSNRHVWASVVPLLAAEREVITIDLPGFGQSPDLPAELPRDLPTMVEELGAVFAALGLDRPHVVGHSLGGLIALRLAQAGLANGVTALAPAGFWNEVERRYAFAVLSAARQIARLPEPVVTRLSGTPVGRMALTGTLYGRAELCPTDALITSLRTLRQSVAFTATLRAGRAPDLFSGNISDVPVTIAWGTEDHILIRRQAVRATATIPSARLVWLPGCGHVPMNDTPERVARVILHTVGEAIDEMIGESTVTGPATAVETIVARTDALETMVAETVVTEAMVTEAELAETRPDQLGGNGSDHA